jgi:PcRGLX-like N-terminal RIFT barrel domain
MPLNSSLPSRRDFLNHTLKLGAVLPSSSMLFTEGDSDRLGPVQAGDAILIHAGAPAGPAPLGAPVETSIPFARGQLLNPDGKAVFAPNGEPVIMQARVASAWPDGSVRWLVVVFEPSSGPGDYSLREGKRPTASNLIREDRGKLLIDSGQAVLTFADAHRGGVESIGCRSEDGQVRALVKGLQCCDLLLTRHDGKVFRTGLAKETCELVIDETGPMRASVRCQGKLVSSDGSELFDFILRWKAYRARPEIYLTVTWINTSDALSEKVRDIRLSLPFDFTPERLVFGCERGVYDGPYLKDWPIHILQADWNRYWARKLNPDGRVQNLSSGGCNGDRAPGWLYIQDSRNCLGTWVPGFHEEYPNEIALKDGELSIGLWPEKAAPYLASNPVLPADPFRDHPYRYNKYLPIMPHPYIAFFDPEAGCLDARQGMAKTQEIVLSVWAGDGDGPTFERKWWDKGLQAVRGHLEPTYAASTGALGTLAPRLPKVFPALEQMFEMSFQWFDRHIDLLRCYGKFDYGDFKYMTAATDYMCHLGTKWGEMGEMPREGYWHNNERDVLLGLLLYYYRTGDPRVWERCLIVSRHLYDIDICHHPRWGMWTHSYGHFYLAQGKAGEPDHSWLLGMLVWAQMTGDPVANDWIMRCGENLRAFPIDYSRADARTVSVYLHMMCQFHLATGRAEYLEATHAAARTLLDLQKSNGGWPAYLANPMHDIEGFVEHVAMALADYYAISRDKKVLEAVDRAMDYLFGSKGEKDADPGESPLAVYCLGVLATVTEQRKYADLAANILEKMGRHLSHSDDPYTRGDSFAHWGVNNPEGARGSNRPSQFLGQTRPLVPASNLAYSQPCLGAIARTRGLI